MSWGCCDGLNHPDGLDLCSRLGHSGKLYHCARYGHSGKLYRSARYGHFGKLYHSARSGYSGKLCNCTRSGYSGRLYHFENLKVTYRQEISLTGIIREALRREGFRAVGFAPAEPHPEDTEHIRAWIAAGRHAGMEYLARGSERIGDITTMVDGARAVIMAALPYRHDESAPAEGGYFIARYGRVRDYHRVVTRKLKRVVALIAREAPGAVSRVFCDSSSVTEKEWAVRAGIGWRGKNSLIINEKIGSYFLLGGIVTTVALDYDESPAPDRCGSCRLCIDACPTAAICSDYDTGAAEASPRDHNAGTGEAISGEYDIRSERAVVRDQESRPSEAISGEHHIHPTASNRNDRYGDISNKAAESRNRTIDARRCLSYMTIESKDEIPEWVGAKIENIIYGCDRCQEVCPWNRVQATPLDPELLPDFDPTALTREQWMTMSEEEFMSSFAESALKRAGLEKIRGTIRFVERHRP